MKTFMFKNLNKAIKPKIVNYYTSKGIIFSIVLIFMLSQIGFSQKIDCGGTISISCLNNAGETFQCINGDVDSPTQYGTALLNPTAALTTPQFLLVRGIVSFTEGYTFAPGSEIIFLDNNSGFKVDPFVRLNLESCSLHGCTKLWKGVEVLDNATLSATDCTFEDAKAAIILRHSSVIRAVGNIFSKNVCGMLAASGFAFNVPIPITLLGAEGISGNTFNGDGSLLETINLASIDPGISSLGNPYGRPYVGIWLRGIRAITIGSFNGVNNIFQNYGSEGGCSIVGARYMGIRSDRSSIRVQNSKFLNIGHYDAGNPGDNCWAIAIYAISSETVLPQTKVIGSNTFSNCYNDINTAGTNLEVKNMASDHSAVSISFSMKNGSQNAPNIRIEDNDITFFHGTAIFGTFLIKPMFIKIKNNVISDNNELNDPATRTGIWLDGRGWRNKAGSGVINNKIKSNSILMGGGFSGISLKETPYMFVQRNTIEEVETKGSNLTYFIGIRNLGGPSNNMILATNTIKGAQINYPDFSSGISLTDCSNTRLACNTMDNINTGIAFFNDCDNTKLYKSNFGYHDIGLAVGHPDRNIPMNVIGLQRLRENRWTGIGTAIEAFAFNEVSALASIFEVNEGDVGSALWPGTRKIGVNDDTGIWFHTTPDVLENTFECSSKPWPRKYKGKLAHSDKKILEGTYVPPLDYPALDWEARWQFADRLNSTLELQNETPEVAQYFQDTYNDSYSHLNRIYLAYRNIWQQETPLLIQTSNLRNILDSLVSTRLELNNQLSENEVENEALYDQMSNLDINIENTFNALLGANLELNDEIDKTVGDLLDQLDSVTCLEKYEQDMQTVIRIILQLHFSSGELSPTQSSEMLNIADRCRYEGGYAVALARGFFESQDSYPQDLNCSPTMNFTGFNGNNSSTFRMNIYPNPVKSTLTLDIKDTFEEGEVKIYNNIGLQLKNLKFTENKVQFSVADLAPGIYFIEIATDNQATQRQTFIKAH